MAGPTNNHPDLVLTIRTANGRNVQYEAPLAGGVTSLHITQAYEIIAFLEAHPKLDSAQQSDAVDSAEYITTFFRKPDPVRSARLTRNSADLSPYPAQ